MNLNPTWQYLFPAIAAGNEIFLNNRYETQLPASSIQDLACVFNAGSICYDPYNPVALQQKLASFLHVDPDAFFFAESEAGMMHWLAYSWCARQLQDGDEVIFSPQDAPMIRETFDHIQHHMASSGLSLITKEFPYKENGEFDLNRLISLLSPRTRLIFVPHIHPVFGTKNEDDIAFLKQQVGDRVMIVVDLSQSVGRIPVNLEHLHCDCAFFSGRNLFSPFHFGIAYIRQKRHRPVEDLFLKREPAHPLAARTLALGIDLLAHIGLEQIELHLQAISRYLLSRLQQIADIEFLPGIGRCAESCSPGYGILSFRLPGLSAEECIMLLAEHSLHVDRADIPSCPDAITVSLHLYNTRHHIDTLIDCLQQMCT